MHVQPDTSSKPTSPGAQSQTLSETTDRVTREVAQRTQEARQQAQGRLKEEVDRRSTEWGEQIRAIGSAMRTSSESLRQEGNTQAAQLNDRAAETVERVGSYLADRDADTLIRDAENFARRQPWVVAVGGLAIGFVAARLVKASSARVEPWGERTVTMPDAAYEQTPSRLDQPSTRTPQHLGTSAETPLGR
jgi:hypothetical protein